MELAAHRNAPWALAAVAFIESSVFPIPPDVMLIPMVLAERRKAWLYAAIATIASVLGGIFGYLIGYFLFEAIGQPILNSTAMATRSRTSLSATMTMAPGSCSSPASHHSPTK